MLCFVVPLAFRSVAERLAPRVVLGAGLAITRRRAGRDAGVTASSRWAALIPGLLLTGFGIGLANPAIARTALGVVAPERSGMASGLSNTFRIGGLATGVAALGAIFQRQVALVAGDSPRAPGSGAGQGGHLGRGPGRGRGQPAPGRRRRRGHAAFVSGLHLILIVATVVVALGAVAAFALVRAKDFYAHRPPADRPLIRSSRPSKRVSSRGTVFELANTGLTRNLGGVSARSG